MAYGIPLYNYPIEWLEDEFNLLTSRISTAKRALNAVTARLPCDGSLIASLSYIERIRGLRNCVAKAIIANYTANIDHMLEDSTTYDSPDKHVGQSNLFDGYRGYMYSIHGDEEGKYTIHAIGNSSTVMTDGKFENESESDPTYGYIKILKTYSRGGVEIVLHDNDGVVHNDKKFYMSDIQLFDDIVHGRIRPVVQEG